MTGLADTLVELERACFGTGAWTAPQVAAAVEGSGAVVVVVSSCAYALGRQVLDEVELYRIGVRPDARRQGRGQRALADFIAEARRRGAGVLHLEVRADNTPALALYRQFGLTEQGRRRGYYRDGCDAVMMSVPLPPSRS